MSKDLDFISTYLAYTEDTECPKLYHLWSCLSLIAACAGRKVHFKFGADIIYPNLYILLTGLPATRKSTAINIASNLLRTTGYNKFGPQRTSREKFLADLEIGFENLSETKEGKALDAALMADKPEELALKGGSVAEAIEAFLHSPVSSDSLDLDTREVYLCLSEYADFVGQNNTAFATTLTNLYDNPAAYPERLKATKSLLIQRPNVNILGGITPSHFVTHIPPEVMGNGFMSRVLLVYGKQGKKKIAFPKDPDVVLLRKLSNQLKAYSKVQGEVLFSTEARNRLSEIYEKFIPIPDIRFQYYCGRRFTHLLKLCMLCALSNLRKTVLPEDVERAHTYLVITERGMPKALGEFGDSRLSQGTQKVVEALEAANAETIEIRPRDLLVSVSSSVDDMASLLKILKNLEECGKIKFVGTDNKILGVRLVPKRQDLSLPYVNPELYWPYEVDSYEEDTIAS